MYIRTYSPCYVNSLTSYRLMCCLTILLALFLDLFVRPRGTNCCGHFKTHSSTTHAPFSCLCMQLQEILCIYVHSQICSPTEGINMESTATVPLSQWAGSSREVYPLVGRRLFKLFEKTKLTQALNVYKIDQLRQGLFLIDCFLWLVVDGRLELCNTIMYDPIVRRSTYSYKFTLIKKIGQLRWGLLIGRYFFDRL